MRFRFFNRTNRIKMASQDSCCRVMCVLVSLCAVMLFCVSMWTKGVVSVFEKEKVNDYMNFVLVSACVCTLSSVCVLIVRYCVGSARESRVNVLMAMVVCACCGCLSAACVGGGMSVTSESFGVNKASLNDSDYMDTVQDKLQCCGNDSPLDFNAEILPSSCCQFFFRFPSKACHLFDKSVHKRGCKGPLTSKLRRYVRNLAGSFTVLTILQIIQIVTMTCMICKMVRRDAPVTVEAELTAV